MNRREFLKGAVALTAAYGGVAGPAQACSQHHLANLNYRGTGRLFTPNPNKFGLALFMTAGSTQPSCGGAFIGVRSLMERLDPSYRAWVQPLLIVPQDAYQPNPGDDRNVAAALRIYPGFQVLEGDIGAIRALHNVYGGIYAFEGSKVTNHGVDLLLLTPSQGKKAVRQDAVGFHTFTEPATVQAFQSIQSLIYEYSQRRYVEPGFCM